MFDPQHPFSSWRSSGHGRTIRTHRVALNWFHVPTYIRKFKVILDIKNHYAEILNWSNFHLWWVGPFSLFNIIIFMMFFDSHSRYLQSRTLRWRELKKDRHKKSMWWQPQSQWARQHEHEREQPPTMASSTFQNHWNCNLGWTVDLTSNERTVRGRADGWTATSQDWHRDGYPFSSIETLQREMTKCLSTEGLTRRSWTTKTLRSPMIETCTEVHLGQSHNDNLVRRRNTSLEVHLATGFRECSRVLDYVAAYFL